MYRLFLSVVLCFMTAITQAAPRVEVEITGISNDLLQAIQAGLSLYQQKDHPLLSTPAIRGLHRKATKEIAHTLQAFGFYQPVITAELIPDEVWRARYVIDPGPPVHVTELDIRISGEGAADPVFIRWRETFPLQPGDVLLHKSYESAKQKLLSLADERGYFEVKLLRHEITVRRADQSAVVHLHLDSGPRYQFGEVQFHQTREILSERFLSRYVPFVAGEPFFSDQLFVMQRALLESGYFEQVEIRPHYQEAAQRRVPIEAQLTPRKRTQYDFGAGYGTDTRARTSVGFSRRWLNYKGHRLEGELQLMGIGTRASLGYRIPLQRAASDYVYISPGWEQEDVENIERITRTVNVGRVTAERKWLQTLSFAYEAEDYTIGSVNGDSILLVPGVSWQRTVADNHLHPRKGWSLYLQVQGGAETLGSDTSFLQLKTRAKGVLGAGTKGRIVSRLDLGASQVPEFNELPPSYRFFAGGDNSVRGYSYKSLGPVNDLGEVVGGEHLLVASVEYDHRLKPAIDGAIFYDIGNAFDNTDINAQEGTGFGLRWRLPIGAIRLDLATALSKPDKPWRLHLTIGLDL